MKKDRRNFSIAAVAACAAILFILLALLALYPEASSRYIDEDHYTGEIIGAAENGDHGDHSGWTDLNEAVGENTSYTMTSSGKFYLSDDLTASLTIGGSSTSLEAVVDLCLNGHMLTGSSNNSNVVFIGYTGQQKAKLQVTVNLYDCGGDMGKHYYKLRDDGVSYTFYELESSGTYATDENGNRIAVKEEDSAGYVRGGLITGGNGTSDSGYGGGITVQANTANGGNVTLNMYGGTIAGNRGGNAGGGVHIYSGAFNMYGGSVEGNQSANSGTGSDYGGGGVSVIGCYTTRTSGDATFYMYGGTIRNNCSGSRGGGVEVNSAATSYNATFYMYGGVIEGNRAQYGGGVGMYDYNGTSGAHATDAFYMYGGTIRDNTSVYGGGGIYMYSSGSEIEISGGTITGNVQEEIESGASNYGGGIDLFNDDTITVSGTAYVYGNWCAGKTCNVGLADGHYITLGSLAAGARIGVTLQNPSENAEITTNYVSGAEAYFWSDDRSYKVEIYSSSYLRLVSKT